MSYQKQKFQEVDKQALVELQYVVYTDLQNFIGILAETYAVTQLVDRNDPLYKIHLNRLITQVNLSKCIHFDTQQSSQNKNSSQYKDLKNRSQNALSGFLQSFKMENNPDLQESLKDYQDILSNPVKNLRMKELHHLSQQNENLDQSLVSEVLGSISSVDHDYDQMRAGKKTFHFDEKELLQKTQFRFNQACQKIEIYKSGQTKAQQKNYNSIEVEEDDQNTQAQKPQQENNRYQAGDNQNHQEIDDQQIQYALNAQLSAIQQVLNDKGIYLEQETQQFLKYLYLILQNQLDLTSQNKLDNLIWQVKSQKLYRVNNDLKKLSQYYQSEGLNQVLIKIQNLINPQQSSQPTQQVESKQSIETDKKGKGSWSYK